ncbi:hypothetical protein M3J09_002151 [Ascochyta lentis]
MESRALQGPMVLKIGRAWFVSQAVRCVRRWTGGKELGSLHLSFFSSSLQELVAGAQTAGRHLLLSTSWWAAELVATGYFEARRSSRGSDWCECSTRLHCKGRAVKGW